MLLLGRHPIIAFVKSPQSLQNKRESDEIEKKSKTQQAGCNTN
ncbi:hypothetical protein LINPERHAP2_LOCUS7650, partial [Linum perenne]